MNGVDGRFQPGPDRQWFPGAKISGVLRVGATGELQPEPVPLQQSVGTGGQSCGDVLDLAGSHRGIKLDQGIGDVV